MHIDRVQSLAGPTGRRVVDTLAVGERQVNNIAALVAIHQSAVSRHLTVLLEEGVGTCA